MKQLRHFRLYLVLVLAAGSYKFVELYDATIPLLHSYLEDLLALPIILGTALIAVQLLLPGNRNFIITRRDLLIILFLFTLYFEGVLPYFNESFTADPFDILCYFAGAWIFKTYMNRALPIKNSPLAH
ncbi:MAG: hypothetical protein HQ500_11140 [Flavobacteriales bacterium]|nr:hypothetical protein [Flavobacteriales bacterium]